MAKRDREAATKALNELLPDTPNDLLSNILERDRNRGGRSHSEHTPNLSMEEMPSLQPDPPNHAMTEVESSATSSIVAPATSSTETKKRSSAPPPPTPQSRVESAIRELLTQPYDYDPMKGPFTVSTMKVPTVISERLSWVVSMTGHTKQEIVAEALKDYFAKLLQGG